MICYCEHDRGSHDRGRGKCNKPGCDCDRFDPLPVDGEGEEPGRWLGGSDDDWKEGVTA